MENQIAGKPIFGQILSYQITNVLIAVVRYYGGTNLGVGGLITAYKTASKDALDKASLDEHYISDYFEIGYPYDLTGDVMNLLQKIGVDIISQKFDDKGPLTYFKVRQERTKNIEKEFSINANYKLTLTASDK
jgi:putative IMPACT (imprinted ancient) family translation regulator